MGDTVTTDHISPAGSIKKDSPTGDYFAASNSTKDLTLGARRGNHEVMMEAPLEIKIKMKAPELKVDLQLFNLKVK